MNNIQSIQSKHAATNYQQVAANLARTVGYTKPIPKTVTGCKRVIATFKKDLHKVIKVTKQSHYRTDTVRLDTLEERVYVIPNDPISYACYLRDRMS